MTEVEIIEKQIARLSACLDRATERIEAIAQERQALSFDFHINESKAAELRLKGTRVELSSLAEERDTLVGAIAELKKRLAAEQQATARRIAMQHTKRLHEQLSALQEMAPRLDACWGTVVTGQAAGLRHDVGLRDAGHAQEHGRRSGRISMTVTMTSAKTKPPASPARWTPMPTTTMTTRTKTTARSSRAMAVRMAASPQINWSGRGRGP